MASFVNTMKRQLVSRPQFSLKYSILFSTWGRMSYRFGHEGE